MKTNKKNNPVSPSPAATLSKSPLTARPKWETWAAYLMVAFISFIIYSNIYNHTYVLDDLPTIAGNAFVQKGFGGFKEILTTRAWDGYNKDINIAAYRPMQLLLYATEYQILGRADSGVSHFLNAMYYIILCLVILATLEQMFRGKYWGLPLLITIIFAVHPLHTEPVANLKSRDELLALFFSVLALSSMLKYIDSQKKIWWGLSAFLYFLGLLSKETPVTFLGVIPLSILYFRPEVKWDKIVVHMLPLVVVLIIFVMIRSWVFAEAGGKSFQHTYLQNPILLAKTGSEIVGTKLWVLGKYVQLLFVPYAMTFTYFYDGVPITKLFAPPALLSLLFYVSILVVAIRLFKQRSVLSYAIFYYLGTIALFSNFFVQIGDAMGERLAFTPSLGYCIAMGYLAYLPLEISKEKSWQEIIQNNLKKPTALLAILLFVGMNIWYAQKTYKRNMAWYDNFALCTTDVETSPRSYILNRQLGLTYLSFVDTVAMDKEKNLQIALGYFKKAVELDPNNPALWSKYGEACGRNNDLNAAVLCYQNSLKLLNNDLNVMVKLAECYRKLGNYQAALPLLQQVYANPQGASSYYVNREIGLIYYFSQNLDLAEQHLVRAFQLVGNNPNDRGVVCNDIGALYIAKQNPSEAFKYFEEATKMLPTSDVAYNGAGVAAYQLGNMPQALSFFERAFQLNNRNLEAVGNLANTYAVLGNAAKAQEYTNIYNQLKLSLGK